MGEGFAEKSVAGGRWRTEPLSPAKHPISLTFDMHLLQDSHLPHPGHFTLPNVASIPADLPELTHYTVAVATT